MKIAFIAFLGFPSKNAGSINVMRSCESMAKLGHKVVLLAPMAHPLKEKDHGKSPFEYYGVSTNFTLLRVPNWIGPGGRHTFTVLSTLALLKMRPNLVIGRYLRATLAATRLGFNTVYELHTTIKKKRRQLEKLLSYNNFRLLVAVSSQLRAYYLKQGISGLVPERIIASPVCREPVDIPPRPASLPRSTKGLAIGYFGKLEDQKGLPLISDIVKRIKDHDFHIVGGTPQQIRYWRERMAHEHVHFHGYVPPRDVGGFIEAMDVCLLPNTPPRTNPNGIIYSSPMKAFDYMAHGKLILASDLAELREILTEDTAIFLPHNRPDPWVSTIEQLTTKTIKDIGTRAKAHFLKNLTNEVRWKRIIGHATNALQ